MSSGARLERVLRQAWASRGPLACLLWPLSVLYGLLWRLRAAHGRRNPVPGLPVPVVVVGNVIVGGAGKTPVTIALVRDLQAHGWRPGVVSRGHGRQATGVLAVTPDSTAQAVGDEPLLIARATGVPVQVGAARAGAARALLATHPDVNVIVCDDGLQHLALARDIEVVVFDDRGTGNGWLIPAGPLREPWPRPQVGIPQIVVDTSRRRLAAGSLAGLEGRPVGALAGIARPEAFFAMLRDQGLTLSSTLPLADHADFAASWPGLRERLRQAPLWLCTEKDAVKLQPLLGPGDPEVRAVPLAVTLDPDFFARVRDALSSRS